MNVLAREGEYWTVVFDGRVTRLRDAKGLRYLDHLLRHPGEEFHALALVAVADPPSGVPAGATARDDGLVPGDPGDAGPILDARAVAGYRRRFVQLQEEVADAGDRSDAARLARAQDELDALAHQLSGGLGLGGRHRRAGSATERARLAVTKAIRSVIRKAAQADPGLGSHLERNIRTGTFCSYAPDPALGVRWGAEIAAPPTPPTPPTPPISGFRRPIPYVGRRLERGLVHELVAAAAGGRGGLLLVGGEAGIGKTRLAEEAVDAARDRGMATFVGRCREGGATLAWLPLAEVLDQLVVGVGDGDLRALLGGAGPEVARVLPSLRRRLPDLPPPLDLPPEQSRQFLFAAVRDLLLGLGQSRPALVVVDDLHWADAATLGMIAHLADALQEARVLVVATYRSDEAALGTPLARTLERLVRHPACVPLRLEPFGVEEVAELVAVLSGRVPPGTVAARLWAGSDGNPFFVEQLVKHLGTEGRLVGDDGELRPELAGEELGVPESLRLLLGHRLHRLSDRCRAVVDSAAVAFAGDVDVDLLAALAPGAGEDGLLDALDEALAAGVLAVRDGDRLGFSHSLVRQSAVAELSVLRRRRLHAQVADALRHRHGDDPEWAAEIAYHLERSGPSADAGLTVRLLEVAARRSLRSAAYEDAADRFRRALALVPAADGAIRARLLAGHGYARRGLGDPEEANVVWLEALDLLELGAPDDGLRALATELCRELGRSLDATGGLDRATDVIRRGLRLAGPGLPAARSRLHAALAYNLALRGDFDGASTSIEEAATVAEALGDDRLRADVLASRTVVDFTAGDVRRCIATAEAASTALSACGQPWDAVQVQVTTLWPRLWVGDAGDARRELVRTLPQAERIGHVPAAFLARRTEALLDLVAGGDLAGFARHATADVEFCRHHRLRWLADALVFAGLARFWLGDWDRAGDYLDEAAHAPVPPVYAGRYAATRLVFLGWTGDQDAFDRLRAELRTSFAALSTRHTLGRLAVTLAEVEGSALLGRAEAAGALYPAVTAILDQGVVLRPPDLRVVEAIAGLAAAASGQPDAADAHFDRARAVVDALPFARQAPDVAFLQAVGLGRRTEHRNRARSLLAEAMAGYRSFRMPAHHDRARRALDALGR